LIGLYLAHSGLTDGLWQLILALPGFVPSDLQALNLSDNQLTEFRLERNMSNLELLNLDDNPLAFPAEEITKQGNETILRFLKDILFQGEREVYEVKMLIVGEGGVGKTTLWHKLQDPDYEVPLPLTKQPSTVGIGIKEGWKFKHLNHQDTDFFVNLWDFGGQEIQYMTHQFFLTRRSFYILMSDGRRQVSNFSYWFKVIALLGSDPKEEDPMPLLVVINKKGTANPQLPYDPIDTSKAYPRLKIINYEVDLAKKDVKLKMLPEQIKEILCTQMKHLPLRIPAYWDAVREELYTLKKAQDHISLDTFQEICKRHEIKDLQSMLDLSEMLHELGVILHHQDDRRLKNFIVLKPEWAVNAVYEILKYDEVGKNQGRFDEELLARVWDESGYSSEEQRNLMDLMLKDSFEVCFKAEEEGKYIYIAPQLLPDIRPPFEWDTSKDILQYTYQYPFMPKGLIGRLIVRLNELIASKDGRKVLWVKGMKLSQKDFEGIIEAEALVEETQDKDTGGKIIRIAVTGASPEQRRYLLKSIRTQIEYIHKRSFPNLKFEEKIPCCCELCYNSEDPVFYNYSDLKRRKEMGKPTIECNKSFKDVPVQALLEGVFAEEMERRTVHPVEKCVQEGELSEALNHLLQIIPADRRSDVILLQSRLSILEFQIRNGVLDPKTGPATTERSQITKSVLDLFGRINNLNGSS